MTPIKVFYRGGDCTILGIQPPFPQGYCRSAEGHGNGKGDVDELNLQGHYLYAPLRYWRGNHCLFVLIGPVSMHYKRACGLFYIKARNQKCANTDEGYLPMQRIIFLTEPQKKHMVSVF